jgi:hypothetical protein
MRRNRCADRSSDGLNHCIKSSKSDTSASHEVCQRVHPRHRSGGSGRDPATGHPRRMMTSVRVRTMIVALTMSVRWWTTWSARKGEVCVVSRIRDPHRWTTRDHLCGPVDHGWDHLDPQGPLGHVYRGPVHPSVLVHRRVVTAAPLGRPGGLSSCGSSRGEMRVRTGVPLQPRDRERGVATGVAVADAEPRRAPEKLCATPNDHRMIRDTHRSDQKRACDCIGGVGLPPSIGRWRSLVWRISR